MDYYYPNTVVVITDNLANYHIACHLFANQHRHANLIMAHQRANMVHKASVVQNQDQELKVPTLPQLVEAHKFVMTSLQNRDYYIEDMENAMVRADKLSRPNQFHVIIVLEGLFSDEQIQRIKARKVYFYENRGDSNYDLEELRVRFTVGDTDHLEALGYAGSMVNLSDSIQTIYTRLGFTV